MQPRVGVLRVAGTSCTACAFLAGNSVHRKRFTDILWSGTS